MHRHPHRILWLVGFVAMACVSAPLPSGPSAATPAATAATIQPTAPTTPASCPTPAPSVATTLGAGFRFSTYGTHDPGPSYWASVGRRMASRFPGSRPQAIWIVGNFAGTGTVLTFPGSHPDTLIGFSPEDGNERALTLFDQIGLDVWLQVEPGDAPVDELIDLMLDRYGAHPSVIGVGRAY